MKSKDTERGNRRPAGTMAMVSIISAFLLCVSAAQAAGPGCTTKNGGNYCPSYQYRGDPGLAGSALTPSVQTTLINSTNVNTLYNYFSRQTNSGGQYSYYGITSSPSVISRTIFGAADDNGNWGLWSFGVGGGSLGWHTTTYMTTGVIVGSPAWDAGLITVADDTGIVYGFGYTDGSLSWTYKAKDGIISSPSVFLGSTAFSTPEVYVVDASSNIYRLNGYSGKPEWNQPISSGVYGVLPDGYSGEQGTSISVSRKALFVAGVNAYNHGIVSSYLKDGTSNWVNDTSFYSTPITSAPVLNDSAQLVYVQPEIRSCVGPCHDPLVLALNQSDGTQKWVGRPSPPLHGPLSGEQNAPPCDSFYYYFSAGTPAYDQAQNRVIVSANAYREDCAWNFLGSVLYSYDATNGGAAQWGTSTTHSISYSSPTVANGVVYIGTDDGYILGFDETNGSLLWTSPQANPGDAFYSPPVVSFDRVHAVSQNGTLYVYCLPVSTSAGGCQVSVQ